ncbi:urea ABC transporter permease subunit UrtB [Candidatus Halocynthiibacter alkanivorans]|uniref:urea ABC transporter permease subunit UrtB n=1 Tax=Candidatus Halocynthiibacter alkanivorans TaxID=2267619 RepID=UPI000DF43889|nr:urea ABC transporter permease subunit UrtB [Candidatus Halocynthiibacter alkanivorans]
MRIILAALTAIILFAQATAAQQQPVQDLLQTHRALIEKSSRRTIAPAINALSNSGLPQAQTVLQSWQAKEMWQRKSDGLFFHTVKDARGQTLLLDFDSGAEAGTFDPKTMKRLKPNSGVRAMIATSLVRFQLSDPDPVQRRAALTSVQRNPDAAHLAPLQASLAGETDPDILTLKLHLTRLLTVTFDRDEAKRIEAIGQLSGATSLDVRAALNPLVATRRIVGPKSETAGMNLARSLRPGSEDLSVEDAYTMMVTAELAPQRVTDAGKYTALLTNIDAGRAGGVPLTQLSSQDARDQAYDALVAAGLAAESVGEAEIAAAVAGYSFVDVYQDPSPAVTAAATKALDAIGLKVGLYRFVDLTLDAMSLGSILFLAAIGLAITFGVMGVINMAHAEFIMMGAYTGYIVQQYITNYTVSIIVALPLAFAVTFAAGVAMERLVIRWLYNRPLETLLATFGISIALQQIAKNIFGTQARPLTSPAWLDGAWVLNDVVSISYIRIAIFVLAMIFLAVYLFIMKRTRFGLETRAVTQNPKMAASMGINPARVNMLTFGLGSGIAGIAGVAIGLFAKVTSELGNDYIVQSFMTVVVGGVGNIWGTLAGATMIGFFQKGVEWLNPGNTLAAQTFMIVFIIIFIQFKPRGIVALKGRAAGD